MKRELRNYSTYNRARRALAPGDYISHSQAANNAHEDVVIKCGLPKGPPLPYYNYEPTISFRELQCKLKVYCDRSIITEGTILTNRPDVVIFDKNIKEALPVPVAARSKA